jgi:hypothetical protein
VDFLAFLDEKNLIKGIEKEATINLDKYPTGSYKIVGISHNYELNNLINQCSEYDSSI